MACGIALHFILYSQINQGMKLMKFVNQYPERFSDPLLAYMVAFLNNIINLSSEFLNIYMLFFQQKVDYTIAYFFGLAIIVELPKFFAKSLLEDKIAAIIFEKTKNIHLNKKGSSINFWTDRNLTNKIGRVIYRMNRAFYVSFIFYFQPYIVLFMYHACQRGVFSEVDKT